MKSRVGIALLISISSAHCSEKKRDSTNNRKLINLPSETPISSPSPSPTGQLDPKIQGSPNPSTKPEAPAGVAQSCTSNEVGIDSIQKGVYFDLRNGAVKSYPVDFKEVSGTPSLRSPIVRSVVTGMEAVEDCRNGNCGSMEVTKNALPVKICAQNADYPRESTESIGVSSLHHIHSLFGLYQSLGASHTSLGKIDLLLMPKFASRFTNRTEITSDNLSYYPDIGGRPHIVVFPKGEAGRRIWPQVNLWESAWVIAHEASHHVFRMLLANDLPSALAGDSISSIVSRNSQPIIRLPKEGSEEGFALQAQTRSVGVAEVVAAVNEGFADLLGFYAAGGTSDIVNGLSCFAKNRDVISPQFADGTPKILSRDVLNTYFATTNVAPAQKAGILACDVPNFQDEHAIGAVIVHGLHLLFVESAKDNKARAELVVKWAEGMPKSASGTTAALFETLVRGGIKVAAQGEKTLSPQQCQTIRRVFPVYAGTWLDGAGAVFTCR